MIIDKTSCSKIQHGGRLKNFTDITHSAISEKKTAKILTERLLYVTSVWLLR